MKRAAIMTLILGAVAAVPLVGQTVPGEHLPESYEPVLFPLSVRGEITGAQGSLWTSQSAIMNRASERRLFGYLTLSGNARRYLDPGEVQAPPSPPADGEASLVWIQTGKRHDYAFSQRVFELSRPWNAAGVEIPVVTLNEAFAGSLTILRVPVTEGHRIHLRIFDLMSTLDGRVRVELFEFGFNHSLNGWKRLADFEVGLGGAPPRSTPFLETEPGYARLNLREHGPLTDGTALRIDVTPLDEGMRIWALITLTDNVSQTATIVTPQ